MIILQNSTLTLSNEFKNFFVIILLKWSVVCLFIVLCANCIIVILMRITLKQFMWICRYIGGCGVMGMGFVVEDVEMGYKRRKQVVK